MRKKRSVEDWKLLFRTALDLVTAELSVEPRATDDELAEKIYYNYNSQATDPTDTTVTKPAQTQNEPMFSQYKERY